MFLKVTGILFILLSFVACNNEPDAPLPTANYYAENAGCTAGCYVHFYDQSFSAEAWEWDFGNGITSNNQNDSSFYSEDGVYTVTLKVWNADNVEDQISKQIIVNP